VRNGVRRARQCPWFIPRLQTFLSANDDLREELLPKEHHTPFQQRRAYLGDLLNR
jgi:hypothetical protein